jgi:hypothetical protein
MSSPEISQELEGLIIRRLAETANRNKVIEELCLERGMVWGEAGQIVDHLIRFHHLEIVRQQSPFLVLAAFSIFLGGVFLVAWNLLGLYNYFWPYFDPNTPDAVGLYLFYSDIFQTLLYFPRALPLFVTGLAMIVGSYFGMKDVWTSFFEWLDQGGSLSFAEFADYFKRLPVAGETPRDEAQPPCNSEETSSVEDFIPKDEVLEYIFDHLEQGQNEAEVVEELWLKFGLIRVVGRRLMRRVLSIRGTRPSGKATMTFVLVALAAFFAGLVWVFQFVFLLSEYLAGIPRQVVDAWQLILRLGDIGRYIETFPVLFGLFSLGVVFLGASFYTLKDLWAMVFLLMRKQGVYRND